MTKPFYSVQFLTKPLVSNVISIRTCLSASELGESMLYLFILLDGLNKLARIFDKRLHPIVKIQLRDSDNVAVKLKVLRECP